MKNQHSHSVYWLQVILYSVCLLWNPPGFAQTFEQQYADWKAKQKAIDTQLSQQRISSNSVLTPSPSLLSPTQKVRLNSATVSELKQLDGIGEKKAQAIIEYRRQSGGFRQIEDIQKVKGIGPALFEKNKARLAL